METDNIIEYLPHNPDEQMRLAIQILQKAYRERTENLSGEIEQMKQLYRERQQDIQDLKSALSDMETQLQKKDAQIKGLVEENEAVMTEKTQMGLQVKRLNRELSKLNKFRMNIIKSINHETLADDLTEPVGLDDLSSDLFSSSFGSNAATSPKNRQFTSPSGRSVRISEDHHVYRSPSADSRTIRQLQSPHNAKVDKDDPLGIEREGKEFFKRAKSELNFKQFNQFLEIIKKLNSDVLTTDQCLTQARQIFGSQHSDLCRQFENLLEKQRDSEEHE